MRNHSREIWKIHSIKVIKHMMSFINKTVLCHWIRKKVSRLSQKETNQAGAEGAEICQAEAITETVEKA